MLDSWAIPPHCWTNQWWIPFISYSTLLHWTRYTLRILLNTGTHIPKISETYMPSLASFSSFVLRIQNARIRTLVPAHLSHAFQTNPHWKKRRKPMIFFWFSLLVFETMYPYKEKSAVSSWQLFFHLLYHSPIKCRIPEFHLHACIWICISETLNHIFLQASVNWWAT